MRNGVGRQTVASFISTHQSNKFCKDSWQLKKSIRGDFRLCARHPEQAQRRIVVCWLRLRPSLAPKKQPAAQYNYLLACKIVCACLSQCISAKDADVNSPASSCVWQPSRPNILLNAHHTVSAPQRLLELPVDRQIFSLPLAHCRMALMMPFRLPYSAQPYLAIMAGRPGAAAILSPCSALFGYDALLTCRSRVFGPPVSSQ